MELLKLENLVTVKHYAELCGVRRRSIYDRVVQGKVAHISVNGFRFIDLVASPPSKKAPSSQRNTAQAVSFPAHIDRSKLTTVHRFAKAHKMRANRFFEAIILGQLKAVVPGDMIFIDKDEAEALINGK